MPVLPFLPIDNILVEEKADLPDPVGGAIILAEDTIYGFNGVVDLGTDYLVTSSGTYLKGSFATRDKILYSGTGAAVRASGNHLNIEGIGIKATEQAMTCSGGNVELNNLRIESDKFGTFTDCDQIVLERCRSMELNDGIELINSSPGSIVVMSLCGFTQRVDATGTIIDFGTSVWFILRLESVRLVSAIAGTDISGTVASANLVPSIGRGQVFASFANGLGTHLTGITPDDVLWSFKSTDGIRDSTTVGAICMGDNTVFTMITAPNVFVKIAGTTAVDFERHFETGGISNRLVYIGTEPLTLNIISTMSITKTDIGNRTLAILIYKNGNPFSLAFEAYVSRDPQTFTVSVFDDAETGDYYEVFIANTENISNILAVDFLLTASPVG